MLARASVLLLLTIAAFQRSADAADPDLLTALATGTTTYLATAVSHEVVGHGLTCAATGVSPSYIALTSVGCDITGLSAAQTRLVVGGGIGGNLLLGTSFATALLLQPPADPWSHHFLWTGMAVNLLFVGDTLAINPWRKTNDTTLFADTFANPTSAKVAMSLAGVGVLAATIPLTVVLAEPLLGPTLRRRRLATLTLVPLLGAGVVVMSAAAVLGGTGQLTSALNGYALSTAYLAAVPLLVRPERPGARPVRPMPRQTAWTVVGGVAVVGLGVLGVGLSG